MSPTPVLVEISFEVAASSAAEAVEEAANVAAAYYQLPVSEIGLNRGSASPGEEATVNGKTRILWWNHEFTAAAYVSHPGGGNDE